MFFSLFFHYWSSVFVGLKLGLFFFSSQIADVGDYETLADAIEQSFQWRAIDVVVCNAGWGRVGYIDEIPIKDLHATINTNLSGMVNTLHVALRLMKHRTNQGHARPPMSVVLVSSLAGLV
jgi:NADP-dependent 3-hydroxy acid dehydrogenase YdfG